MSYIPPAIFCSGTRDASACYVQKPNFAPATIYPKGFGGKGAPLLFSVAARSSIRESVSLHLVPGLGMCDTPKNTAKLDSEMRVVVDFDLQDLRDMAGLLGYKLVPEE